MNFLKSIFIALLVLAVYIPDLVFAQGLNTKYGKNVIQYKDFEWSYYPTPQFDVYYYRGGKELARYVVDNAELMLKEIETKVDYPFGDKITFIVYNSYTDYRQSNYRVNEETDNITAPAKTAENKAFIYFNGNHFDFEDQVRTGIARIIFNDMMFGGSIQERVQNNILLKLPKWYVDGLVQYLGEDWNPEYENRLRNGIQSGRFRKFRNLSDYDATLVGHSVWMYVNDKYGPEALADIIYIMRNNKNVESGYLFVLGKPFIDILEEWYKFHESRFANISRSVPEQEATKKLRKTFKKGVVTNWDISIDGKYVSVVTNDIGKKKVWVVNLETGKRKLVYKKDYRRLSDHYDYNYPILAWNSRKNELTVVDEIKSQPHYFHYDAEKGEKTKKSRIARIERILSVSYGPDGRLSVMSFISKGQTDLMTFDFYSQRQRPLTDDIYDDLNPRFTDNGKSIVFTSNRPETNTERVNTTDGYAFQQDFDIFYLRDYDSNKKLKRVSYSGAGQFMGDAFDTTYFSYITDENGVRNLNGAELDSIFQYIEVTALSIDTSLKQNDTLRFYQNDSSVIFVPDSILRDSLISQIDTNFVYRDTAYAYPLTNYSENLLSYHVRPKTKMIYQLFHMNGKYVLSKKPIPKHVPSETVNRQQNVYRQSRILRHDYAEEGGTDSVKTYTPYFQSDFPRPVEPLQESAQTSKSEKRPQFANERTRFGSSGIYFTAFTPDFFITQFDNSMMNTPYLPYVPGEQLVYNPTLNGMFKLGISDLFKDYRMMGGFRMLTNFRGASYFLSIENLTKRLDKRLIFYRQSEVKNLSNTTFFKETSHELRPEIGLPFSEVHGIKLSIFGRYDHITYMTGEKSVLQQPNKNTVWGGTKLEYTIDNSIFRGLNIYNGSRMKFYGEFFNAFNKKKTMFTVIGMDLRHYTPLFRNIIWANRLAAANSFGQTKIIYFLGGVDNWLFPKSHDEPVEPEENYTYKALATNMRGFRQNIRNGSAYGVLNSEIRIPVFKAILNRPLRQQLLENLQAVGFFDAGSAWNGFSPLDEDNFLEERTVQQGPLTISVISPRSPLVYGYGIGLRTVLLGYFVKFDYAFGLQNGENNSRAIYLSFGTDF